ncbi:MAG: sensor histidine kinase [Neomegalonema sp.]|nr:sensor histidine kinase [Neomegalonema sp.]
MTAAAARPSRLHRLLNRKRRKAAPSNSWTWLRQQIRFLSRRLSFSSLARRIIILNVAALVAMVGGILYLSQYRAGLIDLKIDSLEAQARLLAATIAEAAPHETDPGRYDQIAANEVLRRLVLPLGLRAQIYDTRGRLMGDTFAMRVSGSIAEGATIIAERTPPEGFLARIEDFFSRLEALAREDYDSYKEIPPAGISRDKEVYAAIGGKRASARRVNREDELILSVAVPVELRSRVLGALVISTAGGDIDNIVAAERVAILEIFLVALAATLLLSFALAQTIARPIRRLAIAADKSGTHKPGRAKGELVKIPDYTSRSDEIGHLSAAMRRMTDALYNRINAIESFAADVAHELKNPLTSLRSAVETLHYARTDEAREKLARVINHDVKRMDRLITDISNASRLDAELVREQRAAFDMTMLLQTVVEIAEPQAEKREVAIELVLPGKAIRVRGIESRLAQVLHNLIDNALSFSPAGSKLTVSAEPGPVDGRPGIWIEVADEGPGIPPENIEQIFGRFYSSRPDGEEFGKHSGLGLSICRQIIESHDGKIWAENRTDRSGALFLIAMPR